MEFRLLGPLEVAADGGVVVLGSPQQRALLAVLLIRRNENVPLDAIVAALWPTDPPRTAAQIVRVYVSHLRKLLGDDDEERRILITHSNGYSLRTGASEVDADRFESLCSEARARLSDGNPESARHLLDEALLLWRGEPLAEFAYDDFAAPEARRLTELRLGALEDRFDAALAAGQAGDLVASLEHLADENPLRERLHAQLMLALYRADRQADALAVFQRVRHRLVDELGLEPGETLRSLHSRMLQRDPELARAHAWPLPSRLSDAPRNARWLVGATVVVVLAVAAAVAAFAIWGGTTASPQRPLRVTLVSSGPPPSSRSQNVVVTGPVDGLRNAAHELGVTTNVLWNRQFARAAATSDLVMLGATPYAEDFEAIARLARHYPKKRFVVQEAITSGPPFGGLRNVTGIAVDNRELGYLAGYLAGLMVRPHETISAVGGVAVPSVRNLIAGYRAGAIQAQPSVRVLVDYSRSFVAQDVCERLAGRQIDRGSKVVFDVAGDCGFGAMQAAVIRDVWGIGVDNDLSYLGSQILASAVKRIDRATELLVALDVDGKLPRGGNVTLNLANDAVGLVGISKQVPASARRKLEAVAAKLRAQDQARG